MIRGVLYGLGFTTVTLLFYGLAPTKLLVAIVLFICALALGIYAMTRCEDEA